MSNNKSEYPIFKKAKYGTLVVEFLSEHQGVFDTHGIN